MLSDIEQFKRMIAFSNGNVYCQAMQGETKERWMHLAEQATTEQDPVKLLRLITEINDLLAKKEERLIKARLSKLPESPEPERGQGPLS